MTALAFSKSDDNERMRKVVTRAAAGFALVWLALSIVRELPSARRYLRMMRM